MGVRKPTQIGFIPKKKTTEKTSEEPARKVDSAKEEKADDKKK